MSLTEAGPSSPSASSTKNEPESSRPSGSTSPNDADSTKPVSSPSSAKGKARAPLDELPEEERHIGRVEDGLDEEEIILLATLSKARVTGVDKYGGIRTLRKGTKFDCNRDLTNMFDPNAILVRFAPKGKKLGYLNKGLAAFLAPLIDQELIEIDGLAIEAPKGTVGVKSVEFALRIYGTRTMGRDSRLDFAFATRREKAAAIAKAKKEAELAEKNERLIKAEWDDLHTKQAAAGEASNGSAKTAALQKLMKDSLEIEKGGRPDGDLLAELFGEGAEDPTTLPEHPCPPGRKDRSMRSDLMPFQKQGLAWMIKMEHPRLPLTEESKPVQLWRKRIDPEGSVFWHNIATDSTQRDKPVLRRGGILADEMGLGKTMQTIALISTDDTGEGVLDEPEEPDDRYDDMTLVVCPLSVASNWTDQLHHHLGSKKYRWHLYHGEGRELSKKELRKFDIVITTYQTLAGELIESPSPRLSAEPDSKKRKRDKPKEGTLHSIKWRRVVLDEGHVIKNPKAKMSLACAALKAERRWVLTGTPIINSTKDLGAMLIFLKLCKPLDDARAWATYVEAASKIGSDAGGRILRAVVASTTLRRTKDMTDKTGKPLVSLPELKFYLHKVKLDAPTRKLYDEVAAELKLIIGGMLKTGTAAVQYSHVLIFLLRLRQLANDPQLCPPSFIEKVQQRQLSAEVDAAVHGRPNSDNGAEAEQKRLQGMVRQMIDDGDDCSICGEVAVEPVLSKCSLLLFCQNCIAEHIDASGQCPISHRPLDWSDLISPEQDANPIEDEAEVLERQAADGVSASIGAAKTRQLIEFLRASEDGVKSLVFSQWTSHLNCIEAALGAEGIVSCRFDGSMTQQKREAVIATFSAPSKAVDLGKKLRKGEKRPPPPPSVMLISLKAGALGLNLTCASQVFLMDPWWQASIEQQAIDRVYRIGQTKPVKVFQLVAEDTVEDRVLDIQTKKNKLISQAFSATKREKETQRGDKAESRIQDIKDIFGLKS